jgi:hypothetical protein
MEGRLWGLVLVEGAEMIGLQQPFEALNTTWMHASLGCLRPGSFRLLRDHDRHVVQGD